jgi:hypothetical protein
LQLKPLVLLLAVGCASSGPTLAPLPDLSSNVTAEPAAGWPDEPAVLLLREELFDFDRFGGSWIYRHDVLKVLNEAGLGFAQMHVAHSDRGVLEGIEGRAIAPSGRITPIDPSNLIHDRTDVAPDRQANVVIVLFPEVEIGSVLELQYLIREPGLLTWYERLISEGIPIRSYRARISYGAGLEVRTAVYNAAGAFVPDDERIMTLALKDIAKREDEPLLAGPELVEPYWIFALDQSWERAVIDERRALYDGRASFVRGWVAPELGPCSGLECVARAVAELHRFRFSGFGAWPGRSAKEVVAGDRASGLEKARLLYELIDRIDGVEVRFVLAARKFASRLDESLPRPGSFDHVLVRAKVGGVDHWIDPSCDYCTLDRVPPWLANARVLVIGRREVEWADLACEVATKDAARSTFELKLDARGDATGRADLEVAGVAALVRRETTADWSDDRWKKSAYETLTSRVATARLESHRKMAFEHGGRGLGGFTFRAPGYATPDEDRLLVPLTIFRAGFVEMLGSKRRRARITFATEAEEVEEVAIVPPAGWVVDQLPEPFTVDHPYFRVRFEVVLEGGKVVARREIAAHVGQHGLERLEEARSVLERYDGLRQAAVVLRNR